MIYHVTPFLRGDISEGINRHIEPLPEDAWVCVRDADTMFLTWRQQWQLELIAEKTDCGLITCMTNRCYPTYCMPGQTLSHDYDILNHVKIAKQMEQDHWCEVVPCPPPYDPDHEGIIFGQFMMFPRRVWKDVGGYRGMVNHDIDFSQKVKKAGYKSGIATGVYIFHAFRPGLKIPWFEGSFQKPERLDDPPNASAEVY
jgi:hypothetical protein